MMLFKGRKMMTVLTLVLAVLFALIYFLTKWGFSQGSRSGRLVKLSEKGFLFKEWEGTLDLGSGDNLTWEFSVRDDRIGRELKKYLGEMVTVHYKEHLLKLIYKTNYSAYDWQPSTLSPAKICPFLFLLQEDPQIQKGAALLIKKRRPDLREDVESCLLQLEKMR